MSNFKSKFTGKELEELLDKIKNLVVDNSNLSANFEQLSNKLNKLLGSDDVDTIINTFTEIENFLQGITNSETLTGLLNELKTQILDNVSSNYIKNLKIGTVTSGTTASATVTNNNTLNLVLPKGATGNTGTRGSKWITGTALTSTSGTETVVSITDVMVDDMYLNTSTGNVYKCTSVVLPASKWQYVSTLTAQINNEDYQLIETQNINVSDIINDKSRRDMSSSYGININCVSSINKDKKYLLVIDYEMTGTSTEDCIRFGFGCDVAFLNSNITLKGRHKIAKYIDLTQDSRYNSLVLDNKLRLYHIKNDSTVWNNIIIYNIQLIIVNASGIFDFLNDYNSYSNDNKQQYVTNVIDVLKLYGKCNVVNLPVSDCITNGLCTNGFYFTGTISITPSDYPGILNVIYFGILKTSSNTVRLSNGLYFGKYSYNAFSIENKFG